MKLLSRLVAVAAILAPIAFASPPISVRLRSSWNAPPFLLELIETVAFENERAFFPLVDALTSPELVPPISSLTPEALHQTVFTAALEGNFLESNVSLPNAELALSLHAATPKFEAYFQFYRDHHASGPDCGSWVDWYGTPVCDAGTLERLLSVERIEAANETHIPDYRRPTLFSFDHVYPTSTDIFGPPSRTAILYALPSSDNFRELHTFLYSRALTGALEYVLRYVAPSGTNDSSKTNLAGYGVALDLKKMDYLALDDRASSKQTSGLEQASEELVSDDGIRPLIESVYGSSNDANETDSSPLTTHEILSLGTHATQLIQKSSDPLATLQELSQDFPKHMLRLARQVVPDLDVQAELTANLALVSGGLNAIWINGRQLVDKDYSPFGLLRALRREDALMRSLTATGISPSQAASLLTHSSFSADQQGGQVLDGLFDASDRPEGGNLTIWWNDFEKDKRYAGWSNKLSIVCSLPPQPTYTQRAQMTRPLWPGQFYQIKLNMFNVVLILHLTSVQSLSFLTNAIPTLVKRGFPLRFGLIPSMSSEESIQIAHVVRYLVNTHGRTNTISFVADVIESSSGKVVDMNIVRAAYNRLAAQVEDTTPFDELANAANDPERNEIFRPLLAYADRLGATSGEHAFFNGKHFDFDKDFMRKMQTELAAQIEHIQMQLFSGALSDDDVERMKTYFYDQPETAFRRNQYIYPTGGNLRIVDLPNLYQSAVSSVQGTAYVLPENAQNVTLTLTVVADLDSDDGIALSKQALSALGSRRDARLTFIHNPYDPNLPLRPSLLHPSGLISHLASRGTLPRANPVDLSEALRIPPITDEATQVVMSSTGGWASSLDVNDTVSLDFEAYNYFKNVGRRLSRTLGLKPGERALLVNGRVIGPISEFDGMLGEDISILLQYEHRKRVQPVLQALNSTVPDGVISTESLADAVAVISSVVYADQIPDPGSEGLFNTPTQPRSWAYRTLESNFTLYEHGDNTSATFFVGVLLDPISETAQRWSVLLRWLASLPSVHLELRFNPEKATEVRVKRFYRYVLPPRLQYDTEGLELTTTVAFNGLPSDPIYTLGMDVSPSWLVRPRDSDHDLDNIHLSALSPDEGRRGVEAIYELDYLVIEGHARNSDTNAPPRGLQLQLSNNNGTAIDDTLVVANLGYLQFKSKPGVYQLEIREGRGRDIYRMESVGDEGWNSPPVELAGTDITVTDLEGITLYPRVVHVPGTENEDVLDAPDTGGSVVDKVFSFAKSLFGGREEEEISKEVGTRQADINIFTVASGLLYERFASIMILSVLRHTKSTVKFWFIENFLSPSFLEFIPHLAKEYGFEYELVTYKWPSWLRYQTEKQRVIWGYKILFLDVLFPMDLKKVIFVDADQIVRADLKELVDLDLGGAVYGYTPMGDDNVEMEGFRFWKTGYWADFLAGKPYHISALYVVDLVRFRQLAAGDRLRGQYQGLSVDPNSLANLDQDLPNNMQHELPIFSLHEDWLWCETWCSKDRLYRAKTIDLCQNPLTKEPKLARARQIPEWEEYDSEIARFARRLADDGLVHSRAAAADANALANLGGTTSDEQKAAVADNLEFVASDPATESETHSRDEL